MTPSEARAVLGLAPGASLGTVEAAFRRRAWAAHPDRGGDARAFADLVEARRVLARMARVRPAGQHPPTGQHISATTGRAGGRPAPVVVTPDLQLLRDELAKRVRRWLARHL